MRMRFNDKTNGRDTDIVRFAAILAFLHAAKAARGIGHGGAALESRLCYTTRAQSVLALATVGCSVCLGHS